MTATTSGFCWYKRMVGEFGTIGLHVQAEQPLRNPSGQRQHPPGKAPPASRLPPTEVMNVMASGQSMSLDLYGAKPVDGPSILRAVSPAARIVQGPCALHATTHESLHAAPPLYMPAYSMLPRVR